MVRHRRRPPSLLALVLALLLVALVSACATAIDERVPSYRILSGTPGDETGIIRVLVEPGTSPDGLRAICADLYEKQGGYGRMWVWFYDFAELTEYSGPTLGNAWYSDAMIRGKTPPPSLATEFRDVDWSKRPTDNQVAVWVYRQRLARDSEVYAAAISPTMFGTAKGPDASRANAALDHRASLHFGLSLDEVRAAVAAVDAWAAPAWGGKAPM